MLWFNTLEDHAPVLTIIGILANAAAVWLEKRALHYLPCASMRTV